MKILLALIIIAVLLVSGCTGTPAAPADCENYKDGESWSPDDGCNSCSCGDGAVVCTQNDCSPPPVYADCDGYKHGEAWEVDCNTCTCNDGTSSCTEIDCTPEPPPPPPVLNADDIACGDGKCRTSFFTLVGNDPYSLEWKDKLYTISIKNLERLSGTFIVNGKEFEIDYRESKEIENGLELFLNIVSATGKAVFYVYEDSTSCVNDCVR